jgi:hypothetical protein
VFSGIRSADTRFGLAFEYASYPARGVFRLRCFGMLPESAL